MSLRYYKKDYVQEFMAEAMAFLLRNAPIGQLIKGMIICYLLFLGLCTGNNIHNLLENFLI